MLVPRPWNTRVQIFPADLCSYAPTVWPRTQKLHIWYDDTYVGCGSGLLLWGQPCHPKGGPQRLVLNPLHTPIRFGVEQPNSVRLYMWNVSSLKRSTNSALLLHTHRSSVHCQRVLLGSSTHVSPTIWFYFSSETGLRFIFIRFQPMIWVGISITFVTLLTATVITRCGKTCCFLFDTKTILRCKTLHKHYHNINHRHKTLLHNQ